MATPEGPSSGHPLRGERCFERRVSWNGGPLVADLILLLEIAMGMGLLAGALLARTKRLGSHAWCQSVIALLNIAVVALMTISSFRAPMLPRIPSRLGKAYYAGAPPTRSAEPSPKLATLYLLPSAGTQVVPQRLRIRICKPWVRSVLVCGGACSYLASRHTRAGTCLVYFANSFALPDSKEGG